ncbi:MAG: phosphate transport system regulatory protein PhoU [Alphaproteobacteria bacterium 62-8]|nr:MAG: phosphate transport system regulatory protein PhoU [Alphaproteobacteria bacterium 62-8]
MESERETSMVDDETTGAPNLIIGGAHTLKAFDQSLSELVTLIVDMGIHVSSMVEKSVQVFLDRDTAAANQLIQDDLQVDNLKNAIISRTLDALVRHQPVASDLRLVLAIEHIAGDLERAADHSKNIAKRSLSLARSAKSDSATNELIARLHKSVYAMFVESLRAFREKNEALASDIHRQDQTTDALYDDLFHAVIARIQTGSADVTGDIQSLFVGKSLERIGDHATNIAEEARFLARGDLPSATRQG